MNHVIRLVPLLSLACVFGCLVPSLEELEAEYPVPQYTCSAQYADCPAGQQCIEGACRPSDSLECQPGATRECGHRLGVCMPGRQTCKDSGVWGTDCVDEVGPSPEVCGDQKDNDCDGQEDSFRASSFADKVNPNMGVTAALVADTLLVASVEADAIVVRARGADGKLYQKEKISPESDSRFLHPRLVADGERAMLAWVRVQTSGRLRAEILLAELNKEGKSVQGPVLIPYARSADTHVADLALAMNEKHVLVTAVTGSLAVVVAGSAAEVVLTTRVSVIPKALRPGAVYFDETDGTYGSLAPPNAQSGLFATANATGQRFLLSYQVGSDIKTYAAEFDEQNGKIRFPATFYWNAGVDAHSPFLLPISASKTENDHQLYFVRVIRGRSQLVSVACVGTCEQETVHFDIAYPIKRARMLVPPRAPEVRYVLAAMRDEPRGRDLLAIVEPSAPSASRPLLEVATGTVAEAAASAPARDQLQHVVYLQQPSSDAPTQASLQSFCLP